MNSGNCDTDVIVMAIVHHPSESSIIDKDSGESGRMNVYHNIDNEQRSALIGFHSFIGCDYTSSFFCKGKLLLGRKPV